MPSAPATFRIHPAIGIARVGNSPDSFYIAPERTGDLPIDCDRDGNPIPVPPGAAFQFKDAQNRIRRQAARFRVFAYDGASPDGREIKVGDTFDVINQAAGFQRWTVKITDIQWTVYLANKKASWYQFQETDGEHGYGASHPLRNASITNVEERQSLIIDPGPQTVSWSNPKGRRAEFASAGGPPQSFPPPLQPHSITTLGEIRSTQQADGTNRLLVLGGFGNSGTMLKGFGNPKIEHYANNEGWFDDISDGPVTATLAYQVLKISGDDPPASTTGPMTGTVAVNDPAWCIVAYPRYAPQIVDVVTLDDVLFDMAVRTFAYVPYMYGVGPSFEAPDPPPASPEDFAFWRDRATWNAEYRPYFYRDIWPILQRPFQYQYVMDADPTTGGDPHEPAPGGPFDIAELSIPPYEGEDPAKRKERCVMRMHVYKMLRKQGNENELFTDADLHAPGERNRYAMPLLCGDNPIVNVAPSKFLRLTDTMLFLIGQWARGFFINEKREGFEAPPLHPGEATALDRGVVGNALGGSFCPGAEVCWIIRNPAIFTGPYRLRQAASPTPGALSHPANLAGDTNAGNAASLSDGLEPGDIGKYDAVPWQSDFNECSTQTIDVTYEQWNAIDPASTGDPVKSIIQNTFWWPAHRPMNVPVPGEGMVPWSPTAQTNAGDLQMVTEWANLGFLTPDPNNPPSVTNAGLGGFILTQFQTHG